MGDKAALFGELDHPLDGLIGKVEQGAVGLLWFEAVAVTLVSRLCRHRSKAPHLQTKTHESSAF
jgi:hypothetical protein